LRLVLGFFVFFGCFFLLCGFDGIWEDLLLCGCFFLVGFGERCYFFVWLCGGFGGGGFVVAFFCWWWGVFWVLWGVGFGGRFLGWCVFL